MSLLNTIKWVLAGAVFLPLIDQTAKAAEKPNILMILVDDMGYGDVGFNGCKDIPTPNIDSIAAQGVHFLEGYVTAPQCAPSRAGLLSGMRQNRFGREENHSIDKLGLPVDIRLFGDYMRDAGYRTGLVGKWHEGTMPGSRPLERGFDSFYGFLVGSTFFLPPDGADTIPGMFDGTQRIKVTDYLTFVLGDQAVEFIGQKSEKPFFLYLAFNAPHAPLQAPEEYLKKFEHLAVDGEPGLLCRYTKTNIKHPRQVYAAMVSALDDTIGKVLQSLRDRGLEENTLVYFLSDNGGPTAVTSADNGPLRGVKGDLLEGGARVPFAVQWKGTIPAGQTLDTPVLSLDLLPTALAAAGVSAPVNLDGVNLLPLMEDGKALAKRTLYWRFPFPPFCPVWAVRDGDWKLVKEAERKDGHKGFTRTARTGLYRISDDIHEDHDLSGQYPEIRQKLQAEFDQWERSLPASENLTRDKQ
ncbi:sulfatase family protein [Tichowtungia aerotolerans]|uniref:Sulfatase-like hydrolase/transferase n=1 Tax=Tichowtungia aerotolerans TaxID=2697043 RepID=A0A6P1M7G9_9BACT|nr:sulfatase-like hydrolase/transferase [Tichowtungia aerotolerans]QHI69807.1 sulfatase-like hydrolase/transferase [Tichowtungia aerotolerans]